MRSLLYIVSLSVLLLTGCRPALEAVTVQPQLYNITDDLARTPAKHEGPDISSRTQVPGKDEAAEAMAAIIAPYKSQLDAQMDRELATVVTPLTKRRPESNLGNWMADLLHVAAKDLYPEQTVAFSTANYGGLRVSEIGTGPLIVSEIYELMPFDNQWVLVQLSGAETTEFISHIVNQGGWPVSKELSVQQREDGGLDATISGEEIDPAATYYVAVPDYVANGGSDATMLRGKPQLTKNKFMRDLLIEYAAQITEPIDVPSGNLRMKLRQRR